MEPMDTCGRARPGPLAPTCSGMTPSVSFSFSYLASFAAATSWPLAAEDGAVMVNARDRSSSEEGSPRCSDRSSQSCGFVGGFWAVSRGCGWKSSRGACHAWVRPRADHIWLKRGRGMYLLCSFVVLSEQEGAAATPGGCSDPKVPVLRAAQDCKGGRRTCKVGRSVHVIVRVGMWIPARRDRRKGVVEGASVCGSVSVCRGVKERRICSDRHLAWPHYPAQWYTIERSVQCPAIQALASRASIIEAHDQSYVPSCNNLQAT
jgi:hypothetical protein